MNKNYFTLTAFRIFIIAGIFSALCMACHNNTEQPAPDHSPQLSFTVEKLNSDNNFISKAKKITRVQKGQYWSRYTYHTPSIYLSQRTIFDVELENGDTIQLGFMFLKKETIESHLILGDSILGGYGKQWKYKTGTLEATRFYNDFNEANIEVNYNIIFNDKQSTNFRVTSIKKTVIDGEDKNAISIEFCGNAFGAYDPEGKYTIYRLSNGLFRGVLN
jgi:hypothetical protein